MCLCNAPFFNTKKAVIKAFSNFLLTLWIVCSLVNIAYLFNDDIWKFNLGVCNALYTDNNAAIIYF